MAEDQYTRLPASDTGAAEPERAAGEGTESAYAPLRSADNLASEVAFLRQQVQALTTPQRGAAVGGVHRGSVPVPKFPESPSGAYVPREEFDSLREEYAKLRQVVSSAKAVEDYQRMQKVLSAADPHTAHDAPSKTAAPSQPPATGLVGGRGPPTAPPNRTLRKTPPAQRLKGRICFTPDATTVVHGGSADPELSLWDLRTGRRQLGARRTKGIVGWALSPNGRSVAVAAKDGLALYTFATARPDGDAGEPSCTHVWEAGSGAAFSSVAFSRDGTLVASTQFDSGAVEVRDVETNRLVAKEPFEGRGRHPRPEISVHLDFSEQLLAVAGHKTGVRLHAVGDGFALVRELELPHLCFHLRFDPAGRRLAVGLVDVAAGYADRKD